MARVCELTGKKPMAGHRVSHAVNRSKRRFLPNLQNVSLLSEALGRGLRLRVSAAALRTVEHRGGLDAFLRKARPQTLSLRAQAFRKQLLAADGPDAQAKRAPTRRKPPGKKAQKAKLRKEQKSAAAAKSASPPSAPPPASSERAAEAAAPQTQSP